MATSPDTATAPRARTPREPGRAAMRTASPQGKARVKTRSPASASAPIAPPDSDEGPQAAAAAQTPLNSAAEKLSGQFALGRQGDFLPGDLIDTAPAYASGEAERRCAQCGTVHPGRDHQAWHAALAGSRVLQR